LLKEDIHQRKKIGYDKEPSERDKWIESIGDQLINLKKNDLDFLDNFKLNLYISEIYVFTPAGRIVKLPRGATVLDFAFHIHSELGLHCIGAKVNKKLVNIGYVLNSADQIEVLNSEKALPDKSWLDIVVSARAKDNLKHYFRKQERENIAAGEIILKEVQSELEAETDETTVIKLVSYFQSKDQQSLYSKIGNKEISRSGLVRAFKSVTSTGIFESILPSFLKVKPLAEKIREKPEFSHKKPLLQRKD
jgi:guanosine-3',5'-bis(diphosphate) 3'-pyrophosphohydrolase